MENGSPTTNRLVGEHFPGNTTMKKNPTTSQYTTLLNIPWITDKFITQAIHSLKKDKAAGPD